MWETIFAATNALALIAWLALALLPRWPALLAAILYLGVAMLCLVYTGLLGALLTGVLEAGGSAGEAGFASIVGVRAIFDNDAGVVIGWTHYLALDLFAGLWIARDADAKGFARWLQAPVLGLTLMAGPAGLLLWLALRERRARAQGRWQ